MHIPLDYIRRGAQSDSSSARIFFPFCFHLKRSSCCCQNKSAGVQLLPARLSELLKMTVNSI